MNEWVKIALRSPDPKDYFKELLFWDGKTVLHGFHTGHAWISFNEMERQRSTEEVTQYCFVIKPTD